MRPLIALLVGALVVAGCGHNDKAEEAKIKGGYEQRHTIDDVPPAQREMVRAMMDQGKTGSLPTSKP